MRTISTMWALFFSGLFVISCGGGGASGGSDTSTDADTDSDSDTDTDSDADSESGSGSTDQTDTSDPTDPSDSDSAVDTETADTETADTDTQVYTNPCPDGQHAECYGADPWCYNGTEPVTQLDTCTGGETCYQPEDFYADCRCEKDATHQCLNGDVWAYDACGNTDKRILACESPAACVNISDTEADCCTPESFKDCGVDGNIHWFSECASAPSFEGVVAETCVANAACQPGTPPTCECTNQWFGAACDQCPAHWDASNDCSTCEGSWTGTDCETCGGYNGGDTDNCQCPSDSYLPQAGTSACWTCAWPGTAVSGNCVNDGDAVQWSGTSSACASDFMLPTLSEVLMLFDADNIGQIGDIYYPFKCQFDGVCREIYGTNTTTIPYAVWTSTPCASGHWVMEMTEAKSACYADTEYASVICVGR